MPELAIDTKPLLRPQQTASLREEIGSLEKKLQNPLIQDKGEVRRQLSRLEQSFRAQAPKPFVGVEIDQARKKSADLLAKITDGMPSHEEMRKNPPGAVEKHMQWEARNKQNIQEWKNIQLRLNAGNDDGSVANLEKYRPANSTLNMDGAQISGKAMFLPPDGVGPAVTFTAAQIAFLQELSPGVAEKLALLTNEQRAEVKTILDQAGTEPPKARGKTTADKGEI